MAASKIRASILNAPAANIIVTLTLLVSSCFLFFSGCPVTDWTVCNRIIAVYALVVYGVILFYAFRRTNSVSFYLLLIAISFPFYFGQQVLDALELKPGRIYISNSWMTTDLLWQASFFILISILILHGGYSLYAKKREPLGETRIQSQSNESISFIALRRASLFLIIVLALPTIIYLVQNIQLSAAVGYGTRISDAQYHKSGIDNILGILAVIMPYALLGAFITRRKGEWWQILATLAYMALYMLQGSRTNIFVMIIVFIYVWYLCFSKKKPAAALLQIACLFVVVAVLFSLGSFARAVSNNDNVNVLSELTEDNVLVEALGEAGQTFTVTAKVIEMVPDTISQANGATYIAGLTYILPNGITGNYYASVPSVDEVFSGYLTRYGGVGSSFIAEGYYNFGPFSLVLFFLYGIVLAILQNKAEESYRAGSYAGFFACCASFMLIAFSVRSDVRTFPRYFVWEVLPVVIVQQVVESRLAHSGDTRANGEQINET